MTDFVQVIDTPHETLHVNPATVALVQGTAGGRGCNLIMIWGQTVRIDKPPGDVLAALTAANSWLEPTVAPAAATAAKGKRDGRS